MGRGRHFCYDSLNQLVRVDSQKANKSTTYSYDIRGNLLERKEYAYTTGTLGTATKTVSYAYGDSTWKDLMTSYSGQTITYDTIGNPLQYRDGMNFTWKNGRQLATYSKGPISADYEYDINGTRTKKTFNRVADSVTTQYYYSNGMLMGFYRSDGFDVKTLLDISGSVYGITVSNGSANSMVYFAYNAQGDVIGLYGYNGTLYATYDYDAWGNCTVTPLVADTAGHAVTDANHIAHINPFRYRGYYYDTETGLYYLQSRYYDPETGRFINADGVSLLQYGLENLTQYNMFTYCFNNPVMYYDPTGEFPILAGIIGLAIVTYVAIAARDGMNNKESNLNAQQSFSGGYIYDQNQVNQFKMGRAGAAWNGCGWIAAYNAMIMLGNPQQPADVISYFDNAWGNIALGAFGTNPLAMGRYFGLQGYTGKSSAIPGSMPSDIEAVAQNASACVLLYAHSQGAHYTALKWNGKSYDVYNDRSGFLSIKDYMSQVGGTFIKIWCID